MKRLLEIAGERKGLLIGSCILAGVFVLLSLVPYILVLYILREITHSSPDFSAIDRYLWWAAFAVLISMLAFLLSGMLSHIAAFNILFGLRKRITEKVGKLPMGYLTHRNSGVFKKILSDDVERIETFIAHQIPDFVKAIVLPLVTIAYLFSEDWRLALASLFPLVLLGILLPLFASKKERQLVDQYNASLEEMNAGIVEYVRAIPVMKIFQQSAESFEKYGIKVKNFHYFVSEWIRTSSTPFAVFMSFASNAILPVLAVGLYLYFHNGLSLATLMLFLILGTGYIRPVLVMSNMVMQLELIKRGVQQIDGILNEPELSYSNESHPPAEDYNIRFENVSFAYDGEHKVLHNLSFECKEGTLTALVGPSGAGKSTVAQLLLRFWDIQEGRICIGGVDIRSLPPEQLMQQVSFVFQDSFMFQQTMYENIRMGMDKSREEIENAARSAQIHDLILSLPQGYDTPFGADGVHLSGGEQQRFQLARAMLKDAPILILDEATAFADPENEHKIRQVIRKLIHHKTVMIIAHRLSTITDADQIIVFDKGEINSTGTHTELLENSALYRRMWEAHQRASSWQMGQ